MKRIFALLLFMIMLSSCNNGGKEMIKTTDQTNTNFIKVADDNWSFVESKTGNQFIPMGVNWYDPITGWAPKLWSTFSEKRIDEQFSQMSSLNINVVRVFFTRSIFMPTPDKVSETALAKFDKLIAIAKKYRIRLVMNGMEHWEGNPSWFSAGEEGRFVKESVINVEELFWETIAQKYKDEETIFAWTLTNEPLVGWTDNYGQIDLWSSWVKEKYVIIGNLNSAWKKTYSSFDEVETPPIAWREDDQRMYDYQLFRESIANNWCKKMVAAIKKYDNNHMVTLGYVSNSAPFDAFASSPQWHTRGFNPQSNAQFFDYVAVHFYPLPGSYPFADPFTSKDEYDKAINYLKIILSFFDNGKPVVLEEFGWYSNTAPKSPNGSELGVRTEAEQAQIITDMITETTKYASGYLTWPMYDNNSSTDLSKNAGWATTDYKIKEAGKKLSELYKNKADIFPKSDRKYDVEVEVNTKKLYTSHEYQKQLRDKLMTIVLQNQTIKYIFS